MSPARTLMAADAPTVTARRRIRTRYLPNGVTVEVTRQVHWPTGDVLPVSNPGRYESTSAVVQSGGAFRMERVR